ncbi:hypothetical protein I4U23_005094 [Adineta vaga]|nr:hypothetical protein I4U23_005094 [Adineta vaga]
MSNLTNEIAYLNLIARNILVFGGSSLFIIGIIGNSINILMFSSFPQFNKGSTSVFLLFSFLGSQTTLLTGLLPQIVHRFSGTDPLATYVILCKLRWYIGLGSATVALHCLTLAAVNQYLLTSRNIQHHRLINRRRAFIISFFVIVYTLGLLSPYFIYYTHIPNSINMTQCDVDNTIAASYNAYITLIIYSIGPIIILSIFSFFTWWNIRNKLVRHLTIEQSLTRLVFAQITMVLLASVGFGVRRTYSLYTLNMQKSALQIAQENVATNAFTLFSFIVYSFSFLTFFFSSKVFRQNLLSSLLKGKRRVHPIVQREVKDAQIEIQTIV